MASKDGARDELARYVEYLQRLQSTPGLAPGRSAEDALLHQTYTDRFAEITDDDPTKTKVLDGLERRLKEFSPASEFDSFIAREIFEPVLADVLAGASDAGIPLKRKVIFANSPTIYPSPTSIPSSAEHLIFAGSGTATFCNYWAKAVAGIATAYYERFPGSPFTPDNLRKLWTEEPKTLVTAAKMAIYARLTGFLMGFGVVRGTPKEAAYRIELLRAMETFAIAHEVGHCYLQEAQPDLSPSPAEEFACDLFALPVSRAVGNRRSNWVAFSGAGGYIFLRAAALSLRRDSTSRAEVSTHPDSRERANLVFDTSLSTIDPSQVDIARLYLGGLKALFDELEEALTGVASNGAGKAPEK